MTDWRVPNPRFSSPVNQSDRCCGDWLDVIWEPSVSEEIKDELGLHPYSWDNHPIVVRFRLGQIAVVASGIFGGLLLMWWLSSFLSLFWVMAIPVFIFGGSYLILRELGDAKARSLSRDWHTLRARYTAFVIPLEHISVEHRQDLRRTASQVYTSHGAAALWRLAAALEEIPIRVQELQRLSGLIDHADPERVATHLLLEHRQRCANTIEALRKDAGNALVDIEADRLSR